MKISLLIVALSWLGLVGCARGGAPVATCTPAEAAQRVAAGQAVLVDVREPAEWAETGVAAPAQLLPLSDLTGERKLWKAFLEKNRERELLLYCRSGNRSGRAATLLAEEGFRTVNAGSFRAWSAAGLPTRKSTEAPKP
ncbi:MAG: rhodanese-like domain-containing protein [Opitutae bacterium]|nr:rhodanese-like domain-containing protein [Opitutae bacterium]